MGHNSLTVTIHVLQGRNSAGGVDNTPDTVAKTYALKLYHDACILV